ncbi:S41 family peptidase [Chitinophaga caseinilytica]|uniref:S41 family peptidase n=1 Tax=Chitinophaga caseinilytica TaxID=2267521 RepID=UPI003C2ED29C
MRRIWMLAAGLMAATVARALPATQDSLKNITPAPVFTPVQLAEDYQVFSSALREAHAGLYRYTSRTEMDALLGKGAAGIRKGMTELEFFRFLYPILANIKDGHTKLHRQNRPDDWYAFHQTGLFPLRLYIRDGRAFVTGGGIEAGAEVLKINGQPLSSIIKKLSDIVLSDAGGQSAKFRELEKFFAGYYATFFGPRSEFEIQYKEVMGKRVTRKLEGITVAQLPPLPVPDTPAFRLSWPEEKTAFLRISGFHEMPGFIPAAFAEIKSKGADRLIIDLRDNEGGTDRMGVQLLSYLAKQPFHYYQKLTVAGIGPYSFAQYATFPPGMENLKQFIQKVGDEYHFTASEGLGEKQPAAENVFSGKVCILQNGGSFSVTGEFAAAARAMGIKTVGDESGGGRTGNTSGGFAIVTLPHSKLTLAVPLMGYYMHGAEAGPGGVPADVTVLPTVRDVLEGRDVVFQEALKMLHAQ